MTHSFTKLTPTSVLTCFFFFNDTPTTEIYTLSLHDALPICSNRSKGRPPFSRADSRIFKIFSGSSGIQTSFARSEEHTSELQSQSNLVCRLLLEKKKIKKTNNK